MCQTLTDLSYIEGGTTMRRVITSRGKIYIIDFIDYSKYQILIKRGFNHDNQYQY